MLRPIIAIAAAAFIALAFASTDASARPGGGHRGGFHGGHGGFHHHHGGFRGFGPAIGLGIGLGYGLGSPYYYAGYPGYGGCIRPRRVWTAYGWRIVPVNVCRHYGYY